MIGKEYRERDATAISTAVEGKGIPQNAGGGGKLEI